MILSPVNQTLKDVPLQLYKLVEYFMKWVLFLFLLSLIFFFDFSINLLIHKTSFRNMIKVKIMQSWTPWPAHCLSWAHYLSWNQCVKQVLFLVRKEHSRNHVLSCVRIQNAVMMELVITKIRKFQSFYVFFIHLNSPLF